MTEDYRNTKMSIIDKYKGFLGEGKTEEIMKELREYVFRWSHKCKI